MKKHRKITPVKIECYGLLMQKILRLPQKDHGLDPKYPQP